MQAEQPIRRSATSDRVKAQTDLACLISAKQSRDSETEAGMLLARAAAQGDAAAMVYWAKLMLAGGGRNADAYAAQMIAAVFGAIRDGHYRLEPGLVPFVEEEQETGEDDVCTPETCSDAT